MKRTTVPKKENTFQDRSNSQSILNVIFTFPDTEFSLTEIAQHASIAKSAASRLLPRLAEFNIITVRDLGIVHRIKANTEHFDYVKRKIAWNLAVIYDSTLIEYLMEQFHHPKAIVLFGSFRRGEDREGSDIDIAIETAEERLMETHKLQGLEQLEQDFGRRIQIHTFHRKHIDDNVFANIANGIVLSGYLEVRK
jgi:predicted nucleotidyltransferase